MGRWSWAWKSPTKLLKLNRISFRRCRSHSPLWVDAGPWTDLSGERAHGHEVRVQNTVFSVITDILTLIRHIWKVFVGIVFHSAFTWHTSHTQVSSSYRLWLCWQVATLVLTMNSCIKLTESKRAAHVPLGSSFSHKRCSWSVRLPGEVLRSNRASNRDPAEHCPKPLLSFFLSCTSVPCGSQVGVAQAPGQPVMYLTAPWSRPGGQRSTWLGCSYTAPNRTSI